MPLPCLARVCRGACEYLKASEEDKIKVGQDIDAKTNEFASIDEKFAESEEDLEDPEAALAADEEFFVMLKENCSGTDTEWEARQKILVSLRWRRAPRFWQS